MSLVYVTGVSGSGKSAAMRELERRGFEAHGVDEEGYADWIDRATGEVASFPHDDVALDFRTWYRRHRWVLSEERISGLRDRFARSDEPAFLVGVAEGEDEVRHLFDLVIVLAVDANTVRHRIANRHDNQYGKDPAELAEILGWLEKHETADRGQGIVVVDSNRPLSEVVDDIVSAAQAPRRGPLS